MATKEQRKAQKVKRREKKRQREKQKEKKQVLTTPAKRLEIRMARQTPHAWQGECIEDVAVFDDRVRGELSDEYREQALLVCDVMERICGRAGGDALQPLDAISHRSPFAQWRIFLRGLVAWLDDDLAVAAEAWLRLDRSRRPRRIAAALVLAHRDDLPPLEVGSSMAESGDPWLQDLDENLVYHAKLVRRSHVDRVALRAAGQIMRLPREAEDATVNPVQIAWLRDFTKQYQSLDPELIQALHEVTLQRAFCGPYIDVFAEATKHLRGPRHDRKCNLLRYFFESASQQAKKAEHSLQTYLQVDLPNNSELSPRLRDALASRIHVLLAADELSVGEQRGRELFSFVSRQPDLAIVVRHLEAALRMYPENRDAWQGSKLTLESRLANDDLLKSARDAIEGELAEIHRRWVKALPGDLEPRMALVDYLFEQDDSAAAKEHVDWLAGTRRENPLADAMLWKWNLLEAMRSCRRQAWIEQALPHLDQAAKRWPAWLATHWMPYLRAAVELRAGVDPTKVNHVGHELEAGEIDAAGACMMLGAAQRMRVPAADLKPLRAAVEHALANLDRVPFQNLLLLAEFFWDLERTQLKYPAFRKHGSKFMRALLNRFARQPKFVIERLDDPQVRAALLIMAKQAMFDDGYEFKVPKWLNKKAFDQHPVGTAIKAQALIKIYRLWPDSEHPLLVDRLRQAAEHEDGYYRYFYRHLAEDLENRIDASQRPELGLLEDLFNGFDLDSQCDCEKCRAARGEID